jgi:hypothetical protein
MALEFLTFALSAFSTAKQFEAEKKAADNSMAIGAEQAQQYLREAALAKSQAQGQMARIREEFAVNESSNIAFLYGKQGRDDRSIGRILARNAKLSGQDIDELGRTADMQAAMYAEQARVAQAYGANSAAAMRTTATMNLTSNLSKLAQNAPESITKLFSTKKDKT